METSFLWTVSFTKDVNAKGRWTNSLTANWNGKKQTDQFELDTDKRIRQNVYTVTALKIWNNTPTRFPWFWPIYWITWINISYFNGGRHRYMKSISVSGQYVSLYSLITWHEFSLSHTVYKMNVWCNLKVMVRTPQENMSLRNKFCF